MLAHQHQYLPHYTYQDYQQWEGDWELIQGIPYAMTPAPTITHQEINSKIMFELMTRLEGCTQCKALPEVDWKINEETVVRPDSVVVCNPEKQQAYLTQKPEIIFEVLSPSTQNKDRNFKSLLYAQSGVKYYIMVEPVGMFAEVYLLENGKYKLEGEYKTGDYTFELDNRCRFSFSFVKLFNS